MELSYGRRTGRWRSECSLRRVDDLIAVSRYSEARFRAWSHYCGTTPMILPNCVDLGHFAPGAKDPTLAKRYGLEHAEVLLTTGMPVDGGALQGHR